MFPSSNRGTGSIEDVLHGLRDWLSLKLVESMRGKYSASAIRGERE